MSDEKKKLNLTVPIAIHDRIEELATILSVNKTSALCMAVNAYYMEQVMLISRLRQPANPLEIPTDKPNQ